MNDIYDVIEGYKQGEEAMKAIADDTGIRYSTLMRKLNRDDEGRQLTLTEAIRLMRVTGDLSILDHMCKRFGRITVEIPQGGDKEITTASIGRMAKETGEAMTELSKSLMDDGRVDKFEASTCYKELKESIEVQWQMLDRLQTIIERG